MWIETQDSTMMINTDKFVLIGLEESENGYAIVAYQTLNPDDQDYNWVIISEHQDREEAMFRRRALLEALKGVCDKALAFRSERLRGTSISRIIEQEKRRLEKEA